MQVGISERIWGVITSPLSTLRQICQDKPIGWAIAIIVVASVLSQLGFLLFPFPPEAEMPVSPTVMLVLAPLLSLLGTFIWAGFVQGSAWILKGKGAYFGIFSGLGFSEIPLLFTPFIALLTFLGGAGSILFFIFLMGLSIWSLILYIIAIRGNYNFTTGRAIATFFLAFVPLFLLVVLIIIIAVIIALALGL